MNNNTAATTQVFVRMSEAVANAIADFAEEVGDITSFLALLPLSYKRNSGKGGTLLTVMDREEADRIAAFLRSAQDKRPKGFPVRPHRIARALSWIAEDTAA